MCAWADIVVWVVKDGEGAVEATRGRDVGGLHTSVPLADHVGAVSHPPELVGDGGYDTLVS